MPAFQEKDFLKKKKKKLVIEAFDALLQLCSVTFSPELWRAVSLGRRTEHFPLTQHTGQQGDHLLPIYPPSEDAWGRMVRGIHQAYSLFPSLLIVFFEVLLAQQIQNVLFPPPPLRDTNKAISSLSGF